MTLLTGAETPLHHALCCDVCINWYILWHDVCINVK